MERQLAKEMAWAFPFAARPVPTQWSTARIRRLPGSAQVFSDAQLHDQFRAVEWRPVRGASVPPIVRQGRRPNAMACGFCHHVDGGGRPENSSLAGLPAEYLIRQMEHMRSGLRKGADGSWAPASAMHRVALGVTPAEARAAASYFARQRFIPRTRVVEAAMIPSAVATSGVYRFGAGRQPLGLRIVEGPEDFGRFQLRDNQARYVAYVPPGALARGARLAAGGGGRIQPCAECHGAGLKGGVGPPLAGRSPTTAVRQLVAFQSGARGGAEAVPMQGVARGLSPRDMIDVAAYAASLRP